MDKISVKQRFGRATLVGFAGGAVAVGISISEPYMWFDWGFVRVATAGAFLAGLIVARGFGGTGNWALFRAGFFFSLATVLGAIIAVLLMPLDTAFMRTGLMQGLQDWAGSGLVGPAYVLGMVGEGGLVLMSWCAGFAGLYVMSQNDTKTRRIGAPLRSDPSV